MSFCCYLEKCNPEKNQQRFYRIHLSHGIFNEWAVIKEWGRIGSPGTVRSSWFNDQESAYQAAELIQQKKLKRGYRSLETGNK